MWWNAHLSHFYIFDWFEDKLVFASQQLSVSRGVQTFALLSAVRLLKVSGSYCLTSGGCFYRATLITHLFMLS